MYAKPSAYFLWRAFYWEQSHCKQPSAMRVSVVHNVFTLGQRHSNFTWICLFQALQSPQCGVCLQVVRRDSLLALPCQHSFCKTCWEQHCTVLVKDGIGVGKLGLCAFACMCALSVQAWSLFAKNDPMWVNMSRSLVSLSHAVPKRMHMWLQMDAMCRN